VTELSERLSYVEQLGGRVTVGQSTQALITRKVLATPVPESKSLSSRGVQTEEPAIKPDQAACSSNARANDFYTCRSMSMGLGT
jgi:hypothetical protein